jgi:hypothetical protein
MPEFSDSLFPRARIASLALLVFLLALSLAIRLYDLTDLPLDFHPTRQLLSELKARGMYYQTADGVPEWQRKMAIHQWKSKAEVEPEVFERLVAFTYKFTGVQTWVARIYSALFWVGGGVFLILTLRRLVSMDAALVSAAYFLFLPYAVSASRSFQPDVLMMLLILAFLWALVEWSGSASWGWALAVGVLGGTAIYVKFVAAFFVVGAGLAAGLATCGWGLMRRKQVWVMAALGILPAAVYIFQGVVLHGFLGRQFSGRFIPSLLLSPINYVHWVSMANLAAGGLSIALGVLGLLVVKQTLLKHVLLGLWIAYIVYGLFFDYHIATHDYYQLPLIAIVALSIAPLAELAARALLGAFRTPWTRAAVTGVFLYAVLAGVWDARTELAAVDYRPQAHMWAEIGDVLQHGPNVVALTQDYGSRLQYWGWQNSIIWPNSGDTEYHEARGGSIDFPELFDKFTAGNAYFLVTDFEELDRQPVLKQRLQGYSTFAQGDGYIVYDLQKPAAP